MVGVDESMLAEKLREYREKADLSQEALARKADVPISFVQRIEQDLTDDPSSFRLFKVAKALGVPMEKLLEGHEIKAEKKR